MKFVKYKLTLLIILAIIKVNVCYSYSQIELLLFLQPQNERIENNKNNYYPLPKINRTNQYFELVEILINKTIYNINNQGQLYKYIHKLIEQKYKILVYKIIVPPSSNKNNMSIFITDKLNLIKELTFNYNPVNYYSRQFYNYDNSNEILLGSLSITKTIKNLLDIKLQVIYQDKNSQEVYLDTQRKISINQINYFDHPTLGCLLLLR